MENHRSVVSVRRMADLAMRVSASAEICLNALWEMKRFHELRGENRQINSRIVGIRIRTLKERIPQLRDDVEKLHKEFSQ